MSRNMLILTAALAAATACAPLSARPLVQLSVLDRDSGQWLPEYPYRGERWVAGAPGHRYAVRLTNNSDERVLVVLSVDGVNAVSGQTADPAQAGYVLAPWQSTEVEGWRKSLDDVAQFVFTDLGDSYAARTGRPDDVGVIGIAVFEEDRPLPLPPPPPVDRPLMREAEGAAAARREAKAAAPEAADAAQPAMAPQRIGTGHGAREWSPVQRTRFVRASMRPAQVLQLRYDDMEALAAAGIVPWQPPTWRGRPQAFPGGFVPDPPQG